MSLKRREFVVRTAAAADGARLGLVPTRVAAQGSDSRHIAVNIDPEPPQLTTFNSFNGHVIRGNIFDGLVDFDKDFKIIPRLVTSWTESKDGLAISFKLRNDVRWHDGKPFTSADVAYSLEVLRNTNALAKSTFLNVLFVDSSDPYTAVLRLKSRSPVIWSYLHGGLFRLIPRHLYEGTDPLTNPANTAPVGNGPYIFKEWVRCSHITLERNPDYWDKSLPYADKLTFRFITDASTREAALESGELDYAAYNPVPLSSLKRLRRNRNLVVDTEGWKGVVMVYSLDFNLEKKVFQDVCVRRAFAHAIDRTTMANVVWQGLAKPARGPVPSVREDFFNPDTPQYELDPAKAVALLEQAGLKKGPDGVSLRITHQPPALGSEEYRLAADLIKQQLKKVGMRAGAIEEEGDHRSIWQAPCSAYTRALLAAVPRPQPALDGGVPAAAAA